MMYMKLTPELAEFLGWYFGDGCLSAKGGKYQFSITGDLKEEFQFYEEIVVPAFNQLFGNDLKRKVSTRKYLSVGVCGIYVSNKGFVNILQERFNLKSGKKLDVNLPPLETTEQKKAFLRGLFDTDGSIYFGRSHVKTKKPTFSNTYHYKPTIKFATISKTLIDYTLTYLPN